MYWKDEEKSRRKMFAFLLRHMAIGIGFGWLILSIFIYLDIGSLRTLAKTNHLEGLVYPLLYIFFAITFGSVGMGIGVMGLNDDDDDNDKGKRIKILPDFVPLKPARQALHIKR